MGLKIDYNAVAPVFNIQTYCIHDGPGIRDTVFVKGCPLRCVWCANPESNRAIPELMDYGFKCIGCGKCVQECPKGAVILRDADGKLRAHTDRAICTVCGRCVGICPVKAREIAGEPMTVRQVIDRIEGDTIFFEGSGGGLTVSGGEALTHPVFTSNLLAAARELGIHTAIESCSYAKREVIDQVFRHVDLGLLDVKHMDSEVHRRFTGVPNELILDNIRHVKLDLGVPVILRMPTVPNYNDSEDNLRALGQFALQLGAEVNLLPYHRLGESKNESLGHPVGLGIEPPSDSHMEQCQKIVAEYGVKVKIGG